MGSGRFNYNQYADPRFRSTANFGLGVYGRGAGVPISLMMYAIVHVGEAHNDSREVIVQDMTWAIQGYQWADRHCQGGPDMM